MLSSKCRLASSNSSSCTCTLPLVPGVHVQELEMEDVIRSFEESKRINQRLTELYVRHNTANKTYDEMYETMKFDTFLSAEEAVKWGLADKIVEKRQ